MPVVEDGDATGGAAESGAGEADAARGEGGNQGEGGDATQMSDEGAVVGWTAAGAWHDQDTQAGHQSGAGKEHPNVPYGGYVPASALIEEERPGPRHNQILAGMVVAVAVLVVAMVAYLLGARPGMDGRVAAHTTKAQAPAVSTPAAESDSTSAFAPSQGSQSSQGSNSSQVSTVTSTSGAATEQSTAGGSASDSPTADAPGTTASAPPAPGSPPAPVPSGAGDVPGVVSSVMHDGVRYSVARDGSTLTVYSDEGGMHRIGSVSLRVSGSDISMASLPGCSRPQVLFNADGPTGSAVFGFDGSGYQAYKANGADLYPNGGNGAGIDTYGVNMDNGMIEYRDRPDVKRGQGHHFGSCSSASPDVLQMAG